MTTGRPTLRRQPHGVRLGADDRAALERLCATTLTAVQVVTAMASERGVVINIGAVYKARSASRRGKTPKRPGGRPSRVRRHGACVRCKAAPATHPGRPVGLHGDVCRPCQKAVIEQHKEERWAWAQAARAHA